MKIQDGDRVCSQAHPQELQGTVIGSVLTRAGLCLFVVEKDNQEIFVGTRSSLAVIHKVDDGVDTLLVRQIAGGKEVFVRTSFARKEEKNNEQRKIESSQHHATVGKTDK